MSAATAPLQQLAEIPAMSSPELLALLYDVGRAWAGDGVAVECGSWLGATAAALGAGLAAAGYRDPIYCYDRWEADAMEVGHAAKQGLRLEVGHDLEPLFRQHVEPFYARLSTHKGSIRRARWHGAPIGIFLLDAAKKEPNFSRILRVFGPAWIPGRTVVGFLDFDYYKTKPAAERQRFRCQERFVERHTECFEPLGRAGISVLFRYTREIPWRRVGRARWRERLAALGR